MYHVFLFHVTGTKQLGPLISDRLDAFPSSVVNNLSISYVKNSNGRILTNHWSDLLAATRQ